MKMLFTVADLFLVYRVHIFIIIFLPHILLKFLKNYNEYYHFSIDFLWLSPTKSTSIKECYAIFFYHLKKQLYYLYHTILQFHQHQKTLFFYFFNKILFFNLSLLYLFHHHFFSDSNGNIFLGFWPLFFFSRLAFSNAFELCFFFFQSCILQQSHFSWAMQHHFFPTVMLIPMAFPLPLSFISNNLLAFIIYFQQSFVFPNSTTIPNNLPIFFFF